MADQAPTMSNVDSSAASSAVPADKGKGKTAAPEDNSDVSMMDEDEQSEESEPEAAVSSFTHEL